MTWRTIAASETDADSPVTATLMDALRLNLPATAAGESGAPVVAGAWHSYDLADVGDGADGIIYDGAVDGAVASVETPNFEDGYEYLILFEDTAPASATELRIELYRETAAAYDAADTISGTGAGTIPFAGYVYIQSPRLSLKLHIAPFFTAEGNTEGALTGAAMSYSGTADTILKARISMASGNINSGKIRLARKLAYRT